MPRMTTPRPGVAPNDSTALVAAAMSYPGRNPSSTGRRQQQVQEDWQREVWDHYDNIGEFRYAVGWIANVASRAILRVYDWKPDGTKEIYPLDSPPAKALGALSGGYDGQSQFIHDLALHLALVGECYIVDRPVRPEDDPLRNNPHLASGRMWEVIGTNEMKNSNDSWWIEYGDGVVQHLGPDDTVIRLWRRHPKRRMRADAPPRSALTVLREIRRYDAHIAAQTDSRLTGAGVFLIPSEMTVKSPDSVNVSTADVVVNTLVEAAVKSKEGQGTAMAQVPIVFTGPGDVIKNAKHIRFWGELDAKAQTMREAALRRMAASLDLPQEIVMGTSEMNRWGAWQVEESSVKAHVEPLLSIICSSLTSEYMHAFTKRETDVICFDTSTLRIRPNRSKEAIELYDRGQLSAEALLRETGFEPGDLPSDDERKMWLLFQMVKASWDPVSANAAAKALGVDLGLAPTDAEGREARPDPSLEEHPTQAPPERSVSDGTAPPPEAAVAAAMLAHRAMERAGNRLRTLTGQKPTCSSENTHLHIQVFPDKVEDLLRDSFSECETFGLTAEQAAVAKRYCRDSLLIGRPFSYRDALTAFRGK